MNLETLLNKLEKINVTEDSKQKFNDILQNYSFVSIDL